MLVKYMSYNDISISTVVRRCIAYAWELDIRILTQLIKSELQISYTDIFHFILTVLSARIYIFISYNCVCTPLRLYEPE